MFSQLWISNQQPNSVICYQSSIEHKIITILSLGQSSLLTYNCNRLFLVVSFTYIIQNSKKHTPQVFLLFREARKLYAICLLHYKGSLQIPNTLKWKRSDVGNRQQKTNWWPVKKNNEEEEQQLFNNANFTTALRNLEIVLNLKVADGPKKRKKEKSHHWNKLTHWRQEKACNCDDLEAEKGKQ